MKYDPNNIFNKIIKNEVESPKILENEYVIAINDIDPVAPIHVLIIPKKGYVNYPDFIRNASSDEIVHFFKSIDLVAEKIGAKEYRLVTNNGSDAGQSVFHFHVHLIGGAKLEDLIDKGL